MNTHGNGSNFTGGNNSSRNSNSAYIQLSDRIQHLTFNPFQHLVFLWLGARGYRHIRSLGRHHRRGRRSSGGADFLATKPGSGVRTAIQVRHWRTPIQRRVVDEFWGFLLRSGVPTGLIVSNSTFSKRAIAAATEYPGRSIQLIGVEDLSASLVSAGLGSQDSMRDEIDEAFFRVLHAFGFASTCFDSSDSPKGARGSRTGLYAGAIGTEGTNPEPHSPQNWSLAIVAVAAFALIFLTWLHWFGGRP